VVKKVHIALELPRWLNYLIWGRGRQPKGETGESFFRVFESIKKRLIKKSEGSLWWSFEHLFGFYG